MDPELQGVIHLAEAMAGKDINTTTEEIGKSSQRHMAFSQRLPRKMNDGREVFEALGFRFGEDIGKLFVSVEFPEGWKIEPTDHYMWSDLVDNRGRKRGSIFYKPDFWDQDAFIRLNRRYYGTVERDYDWVYAHEAEYPDRRDAYQNQPQTLKIIDHDGTILWSHGPTTPTKEGIAWPESDDFFHRMVEVTLDHMFPEHKDVMAYWD
jgi:hypothetical protein